MLRAEGHQVNHWHELLQGERILLTEPDRRHYILGRLLLYYNRFDSPLLMLGVLLFDDHFRLLGFNEFGYVQGITCVFLSMHWYRAHVVLQVPVDALRLLGLLTNSF